VKGSPNTFWYLTENSHLAGAGARAFCGQPAVFRTASDNREYSRFKEICAVYSRSHRAVLRFYDEAGNVIETHEHKGDFKEW